MTDESATDRDRDASAASHDSKDASADAGANADAADGATKGPGGLRVFVSSARYNGNLGGLAGADAKCSQLAADAKLGGQWVAWVGTPGNSAKDRLTSAGPWRLVNGPQVAANKADLVDGTIAAIIDRTENGVVVAPDGSWSGYVWTGTLWNFNADSMTCAQWTSASANDAAGVGKVQSTMVALWTFENRSSCDKLQRLYCFER